MAKKPGYAKVQPLSPFSDTKRVKVSSTNPFAAGSVAQETYVSKSSVTQTSSIGIGGTSLAQEDKIYKSQLRYTSLAYLRLNDAAGDFLELVAKNLVKSAYDISHVVDLISKHTSKPTFDAVSDIFDTFSRTVYFRRLESDFISESDYTIYTLGKVLKETPVADERLYKDITKPLPIDYVGPQDNLYLHPTKLREDTVSPPEDFTSWSFSKVLKDYANPVDLLSVPDGSTYYLVKTIRNTLQPFDTFNRAVEYIRYAQEDIQNINDDFSKVVQYVRTPSETLSTSETTVYDLVKVIADSSPALENKYLDLTKPLQDSTAPQERKYLALSKAISPEVLNTDDNFSRTVLFNRTQSDSVSTSDSLIFVNVKDIFDTISTPEFISWVLDKLEAEEVIPSDTPYLNATKPQSDSVNSGEYSIWTLNKLFSDFATPEDLLEVPDGSAYTLSKYKHNFVGTSDNFSRTLTFVREYSDTFISLDKPYLNISRPESDSVSPTDRIIFGGFKSLSDTVIQSDSGTLISQGYMDSNLYFAEDYIGEYRTFT